MKQNAGHTKALTIFCVLFAILNCKTVFAQPVADFSATPQSGCAPLVVQFLDNSQGTPTGWNWNLGNGAVSNQKNPSTTYINPGLYSVKLTVTNADGSNSITKTQYITVYGKPAVNFTAGDSTKCVPFATTFRDLSTTSVGSITSWDWDFDDGTVSNEQHPLHQYNNQGNYNITLRVTNSGGCINSISKLSFIKASDSIRTSFTFNKPVQCKAPETIRFLNNTTGPGNLSYLWNFGDNTTSTQRSPAHTYINGGVFSIRLVVNNNLGCTDTVLLKDTLVIKNNQSVIAGPDSVCLDINGHFTNGTIPAPLSTSWRFDDGVTTFGTSTMRQWSTPGVYPLKMISRYSTCIDSAIKMVTVMSAPSIDIRADDSASCKAPFTVRFTAVAQDAVNWTWNFGDSTIATEANPTHTYTTTGEFNVKLTAINNAGCESIVRRNPFIKIGPPRVIFDDTASLGGCVPFVYRPAPTIISPETIQSYLWDFGNGTTSTLPAPATSYNSIGQHNVVLTTTTTDGCTSVANATIFTGTQANIDFNVSPTTYCPGTDIQFTDASTNVNQWKWVFGDGEISNLQNPLRAYTDTGTFDVKLVAWSNGCPDSVTKLRHITILPGLSRYLIRYNCSNKREVEFKDSSIGALSWYWDFGDGTSSTLANPVHIFPAYQDYLVSLTTTSASCTNTKINTVRTINEIAGFTSSDSVICKKEQVTFFLNGINKRNLKYHIWNFGDGNIDSSGRDSISHVYEQPGSYSVTLTIADQHDCTDILIKNNFIRVLAPLAAFRSNTASGCAGKTLQFNDLSAAADGSNNIARWIFDFGDGNSQEYTAPLPTPLEHAYAFPGTLYPSLVIVDSAGCRDSISYVQPVNIYKPEADFFSPNYNTCMVDTVLFRNPSSGTRLSYLWDFGDGSFSTDAIPFKQFSANGNYTIKLVVTDSFGCTDSLIRNNYVIVREVAAGFSVSDSTGTCIPFQVKFTNTSQNALANRWNFGDGGLSATLNPIYYFTAEGEYFVTLTASRSPNCVSSFTQRIKVSAPSGTLSYAPLSGCAPLDVNFIATSPDEVSFIWDFGDGTSFTSADSAVTHQFLLPGQFVPKVILKDSSGCVVPINSADTINLYSSKVNFGVSDSLVCGATAVSFYDSTTSGSPVLNYEWQFGDGTTSNLQNPRHIYANEGVYTIKLFMNTVFGCRDSLVKEAFIRVAQKPDISISGDTLLCGPANIAFSGNLLNVSTEQLAWAWDFGNGNNSNLQVPAIQQYSTAGIYNVQLIAQNTSGCRDTALAAVTIRPLPSVFAGSDTSICEGQQLTLLANGTALNYQWQPSPALSCTNCANPVASMQADAIFVVTGEDAAGCIGTDSITVLVKHPFSIGGLQLLDSLCLGKSLSLNVNGAENYSWTPVNGISNPSAANILVTPRETVTYQVTGFDSANCFRDSAAITIKVNSAPVVNAGPDLAIVSGRSAPLNTASSNDVVSWEWTPSAGLSCTNCPSPVAAPFDDITYTIKVTNPGGCTATDDISIRLSCGSSNLFLPTAFTPDGNGNNEVFYPKGVGIFKISSFQVFNRQGALIYIAGNFNPGDQSRGWNGTYKGLPAPVGNYIYTIEYLCENKKTEVQRGNILLLR